MNPTVFEQVHDDDNFRFSSQHFLGPFCYISASSCLARCYGTKDKISDRFWADAVSNTSIRSNVRAQQLAYDNSRQCHATPATSFPPFLAHISRAVTRSRPTP
jgi:hypothetical protein